MESGLSPKQRSHLMDKYALPYPSLPLPLSPSLTFLSHLPPPGNLSLRKQLAMVSMGTSFPPRLPPPTSPAWISSIIFEQK